MTREGWTPTGETFTPNSAPDGYQVLYSGPANGRPGYILGQPLEEDTWRYATISAGGHFRIRQAWGQVNWFNYLLCRPFWFLPNPGWWVYDGPEPTITPGSPYYVSNSYATHRCSYQATYAYWGAGGDPTGVLQSGGSGGYVSGNVNTLTMETSTYTFPGEPIRSWANSQYGDFHNIIVGESQMVEQQSSLTPTGEYNSHMTVPTFTSLGMPPPEGTNVTYDGNVDDWNVGDYADWGDWGYDTPPDYTSDIPIRKGWGLGIRME